MTNDKVWTTVKVSVRIRSEMIDLHALEDSLNVRHSTFVRKGARLSESFPNAMLDTWVYELFKGDASDLVSGIRMMEEFLAARKEAFQALRSKGGYNMELYLSYHSSLAQGRFHLPPELLILIGELGLSFVVSILSWGEVEGCPLESEE
jgi:hypothetical protein